MTYTLDNEPETDDLGNPIRTPLDLDAWTRMITTLFCGKACHITGDNQSAKCLTCGKQISPLP